MDFALTAEQEMLRGVARGLLEKERQARPRPEPEEVDEPYSAALWQKMADQGWMGIAFPSQFGGADGNIVDLVVLIEEMGRALLNAPFVPTVVYGGLAILHFGSEKQKRWFLPKIAAGELIMTLALTEADPRFGKATVVDRIEQDVEGYRVSGTRLFVPDADVADCLLWAAQEKGTAGLYLIDARGAGAIARTLLRTTALDRQFEVVLDDIRSDGLLGEPSESGEILAKTEAWGSLAQCAIILGSIQRVLEMSVAHAQERVQFDRPIGSFQAIQHHCANMLTDIDLGRFLTYQAAWMLSEGLPCTKQVSAAKAYVGDAYIRVCELAHQILGGNGLIDEHEMPLISKRAIAGQHMFGNADYHRELVVRELGLTDSPALAIR